VLPYRLRVVSLCSSVLAALVAPFHSIGPAACASYIALSLIIGWSALQHRSAGWRTGFLFCVLTLTMPVWVLGSFWMCQMLGAF
jgi:hypothetical protein